MLIRPNPEVSSKLSLPNRGCRFNLLPLQENDMSITHPFTKGVHVYRPDA